MTTQHTPGPWTTANNAIYGSSGLIKPLVAFLDDRFADDEAANNARLIAAAPDLLIALEACLHRLDEHDDQSAPECLMARAAIAKATGDTA